MKNTDKINILEKKVAGLEELLEIQQKTFASVLGRIMQGEAAYGALTAAVCVLAKKTSSDPHRAADYVADQRKRLHQLLLENLEQASPGLAAQSDTRPPIDVESIVDDPEPF